MKKIGSVMLIMALGVWGCVSVDHSTVVDTDTSGYATGQFRDVRHGKVANFGIFGGGAGAAAASTATGLITSVVIPPGGGGSTFTGGPNESNNSGGGGGMLGLRVYPAPTQGDPMPFARSIAMINYSKMLKKITYDDAGLVSYEFRDIGPGPHPSSFGHQPIQ